MNRFFDCYEWRRGFPRRGFARLDDLEPILPGPEDDLTFILDVVDADWEGFGAGGMFDLDAPDLKARMASHWRARWGGEPVQGPDGLEEVPVYRVEVSLPRGHRFSPPADIAAMVVPHHGADMGPASHPYSRSASAYARLFYSFGPGNGHGPKTPPARHPLPAAVTAHMSAGWSHGGWSAPPPGHSLASADFLVTATHLSSHLDGAAAGWTGPPSLRHLLYCPNAMPVSQF